MAEKLNRACIYFIIHQGTHKNIKHIKKSFYEAVYGFQIASKFVIFENFGPITQNQAITQKKIRYF